MEVFYRDTWAEIDLDCIYENVQNMKRHLQREKADIIAVVKADGYGHGAVQVANTALEAGATMLAVALLDEAVILRKAGIDVPILVMGWIRPKDVAIAIQYKVVVTVFQEEWLRAATEYITGHDVLHIHLKLDTGMGRIGIKYKDEADQILAFLKKDNRFYLNGVYTHFATADEKNDRYFLKQYDTFLTMLGWIKEWGFTPGVIHCANSATALKFPEKVFSAVRFGISMYGLIPSSEMKDELPFALKQAFSLHSNIIHVKEINKGERISYGGTYEAKQDGELIATLPIGYADGWIRKLNQADVIVNGKRYPIVGKVCMDQMMVKLDEKVPIGTKATLIGRQGDEEITIDEIAEMLDTITYEIPCMISYRVPRMIFRKKRIIEVKHYFDNN